MAFKLKGAAPVSVTEFELHESKKTGRVTVRAIRGGKKFSLVSFQNGSNGDTGSIVLHGKNAGLGFKVNAQGVPLTTTTAT